MSDQREKGKGFFARLLGGSQPQPVQAEKPIEDTPTAASTPAPAVVDVAASAAAPVSEAAAVAVPTPVA